MAANTPGRLLLAAFMALVIVQRVESTCYLLDASATCAVYWKTAYCSEDDTTGVTKMSECPEGIAETWKTPFPDTMFAEEEHPAIRCSLTRRSLASFARSAPRNALAMLSCIAVASSSFNQKRAPSDEHCAVPLSGGPSHPVHDTPPSRRDLHDRQRSSCNSGRG